MCNEKRIYHKESESILEKLKEEQNSLRGTIEVSLGDVFFTLINKDLIGNVIETWFNKWVILNNIVAKKISIHKNFLIIM